MPQEPIDQDPDAAEGAPPEAAPADSQLEEREDEVGDFEVSPRTQALSMEDLEMLDDAEAEEIVERPRQAPPRLPTIAASPPPAPMVIPVQPPAPPEPDEPAEPADAAPDAAAEAPPSEGEVSEAETSPSLESNQTAELPPAPAKPSEPTVIELAVAEAQSEDWQRHATELRTELEAETDKARAALLAYELGELIERRLRDEATAVKAFGRALQADPSLRPNLWAIRRVFYRRALWPNLIKLIDAEIRFARDDVERADLLVEKGRILEDRTGDRVGARAAYDRATALAPQHLPALISRERTALLDRDDEALARTWRALADAAAAPARKVAYLLDLARLEAQKGNEGVRAALAIMAQAAELGAERDRVARERERLAEKAGDLAETLAALDARAALALERFGPAGATAATDGVDSRVRHELLAIRRRQARVARDAGDLDRAWSYLEQAAQVVPDEPLLLYDLADLAEDSGRAAELAEVTAHLMALEIDPARQQTLRLRRADALARAGRGEEADAVLDSVVAEAPGYLAVIDLRARRALEAGAWDRVAALYAAEGAAARLGSAFGPGTSAPDPAWAAAAYVAAGDVYDVRLDDPKEARACYAQALEVEAGYRPAAMALCALHEREARWEEAAAIIEKQLETHPDDQLLDRLAALRERQGDKAGALAALQRLAERRPDDLPLRFRIDELLAEAGRADERAQLLARVAEKIDDPPRQAAIYLEVARILDEDLDRPAEAAQAYGQVLALAPPDEVARAALAARAALLRRAGAWEELVAELRGEAQAGGPGAARALREAGAILERRLVRPADATAVYRELVAAAPDDPAALRALAGALVVDTQAENAAEELAQVMEREAALGEGGHGANDLVRLGETLETLGRDEQAAAAYARAAEEKSPHAAWALVSLAARRGDTAALAAALSGMAHNCSDAALADDLHEEAAWLVTGEPEEAAARFEAICARSPARNGAQLGRALLAARRRDGLALASALTAQAERTTDHEVAAALLLRAAALQDVAAAGENGGHGTPSQLAARALALRPDDAGAIVAAAERDPAPGVTPQARNEILVRRAELSHDAQLRAQLGVERAVELAAAGLLGQAGLALGGVLAVDPNHLGALQLLRRVARAAGDRDTLARASLRIGRLLADPTGSAEALVEAATILDQELKKSDLAGPIWREVLDRDPLHDHAYARAHAILSAGDDAVGLHELLSHRLSYTMEPAAEVPLRLHRAQLARRAGDLHGAATDLERILVIADERASVGDAAALAEDSHLDALSMLADVRLLTGRGREAAELLERLLAITEDAQRRSGAELRLAGVLCEEMGDLDGAIDHLEQVLRVTPSDISARERLVDVLLRKGDHERAAEELEQLSAGRHEPELRARDELKAATLFRQRLKDVVRSRRALDRARRLDPLNLDVVRELAAITDGDARVVALSSAIADARAAVAAAPSDAAHHERLAAIADLAGDETLAGLAAGALLALGKIGGDRRVALQTYRLRLTPRPKPARGLTEDDWRSHIEHPDARSALTEVWLCIAEAAARLEPSDPAQLGFAKTDRIAPKALAKQAPFVDTIARAFGLPEIEVWVAARKSGFARAIAAETPVILLGEDVAKGETVETRHTLGRVLAYARRHSGGLAEAAPSDLTLLFAAAVKLAGGDPGKLPMLSGGLHTAANIDERAKGLAKHLSRRDKKSLPLAVERLVQAGDLAGWIKAMRATAARAALLLCGDLSVAVARDKAEGLADDLLAWGISEDHTELRKELGI